MHPLFLCIPATQGWDYMALHTAVILSVEPIWYTHFTYSYCPDSAVLCIYSVCICIVESVHVYFLIGTASRQDTQPLSPLGRPISEFGCLLRWRHVTAPDHHSPPLSAHNWHNDSACITQHVSFMHVSFPFQPHFILTSTSFHSNAGLGLI